jgi:hypothetical protein
MGLSPVTPKNTLTKIYTRIKMRPLKDSTITPIQMFRDIPVLRDLRSFRSGLIVTGRNIVTIHRRTHMNLR